MERFLQRHQDRVRGVLSGFDRVLFRGTLRSISYRDGMDIFLSSQHVLYKDFGAFVQRLSDRLKEHAQALARKQGRPFRYLPSPSISKEDIARRIIREDGIEEGLICVLSCVEPCKSFTIRRDRQARQLVLVPLERKCLHLYFYFIDRDFGLRHVRLQTWLPFTMQVCLNGREWLARQMDRAADADTKTTGRNANAAAPVADAQDQAVDARAQAVARKQRVARRFIEAHLPTIHRDIALVLTGDTAVLDEFQTLAGPPITTT